MMFIGGAVATAIGGLLAYWGSWRLVYLVYGIAEFIVALIMMKKIKNEEGTSEGLGLFHAYKVAFDNRALIKTVSIVFLNGYGVFGSSTYAGDFIQETTPYNILLVGLILTFLVWGGRKSASWREHLGKKL
jgi:predicted MFS family arabinose efflux permease